MTRPLVVVYHGAPIGPAVEALADVRRYQGEAFAGQYAREGSGVVPRWVDLARGRERVVLVGFSEGAQAVRSHLRDGRAHEDARLVGVVQLDGGHASRPPSDALHLRPWLELRASGKPFAFTSSRIAAPPAVLSTRETVEALGWPTSDGLHVLGPGQVLRLTGGADGLEHSKHASMGEAEVLRLLEGRGAPPGVGAGSGSSGWLVGVIAAAAVLAAAVRVLSRAGE